MIDVRHRRGKLAMMFSKPLVPVGQMTNVSSVLVRVSPVPLLALRTAKFIAKQAYQGKECCLRFLLRFFTGTDHPPFFPETSPPSSPVILDARKRQHSTSVRLCFHAYTFRTCCQHRHRLWNT